MRSCVLPGFLLVVTLVTGCPKGATPASKAPPPPNKPAPVVVVEPIEAPLPPRYPVVASVVTMPYDPA
ncbi:MAG: hypothetical protein ABI743_09910, partial [bacterium]